MPSPQPKKKPQAVCLEQATVARNMAKQRIVGDAGARHVLFVSPNEGWILTAAEASTFITRLMEIEHGWPNPEVFDRMCSKSGSEPPMGHVWASRRRRNFLPRVSD